MSSSPNATPSASARLTQLEAYLRSDPDNASLLGEAFDAALQAGQLDAADFHLAHARALGHDRWRWGLNAIHLQLARHHWSPAILLIEELLAAPMRPEALTGPLRHDLAYALLRDENFDQASGVVDELLREAGEDAPALPPATQSLCLRVWHRQYAFERALAWAQARDVAGALAPEAAGVASLLALDASDFANAARWSAAALRSNAMTAEALVAGSASAIASRDVASAETLARGAIAMNAEDGRSWSMLGLVQMMNRDLATARASLERAVKTMPGHVGTWLSLGWACLLMGDPTAALDAFQAGLALDRNFAESHGGVAAAQAALGLREEAQAGIDRAQRLDRASLSANYAVLLLNGQDMSDGHALNLLARRLLGDRRGPNGEPLSDWLPPAA